MASLEFNKIAAAILATALGYLGIKEISHLSMHTDGPETPAYALAMPELDAGEVEALPAPFPTPEWVSAMDATKGAKVFKKCQSCHTTESGGANGTGPNLWNIVGQSAGKHDAFAYSSAMTSAGITWDYESLDTFLLRPKDFVSGTKMAFVGLKKDEDRAAVIEFLRQQAPSPMAQPEPAIVEVETAEAPEETTSEEAIPASDIDETVIELETVDPTDTPDEQ